MELFLKELNLKELVVELKLKLKNWFVFEINISKINLK